MDTTIRSLPLGGQSQTLPEAIRAVLDSIIAIGSLWVCMKLHGSDFDRPEVVLSMLVFALTFPSKANAFERRRLLVRDVFASWALTCFAILFFGYAGRFLGHFDLQAMAMWALATPVLITGAHLGLARVVHSMAVDRARKVLIVGINPIAGKLVGKMQAAPHLGLQFSGFVDDRAAARLNAEAQKSLLGRIDELSALVVAHSIDVVYITLPISSHPRIMAMLSTLRDTTASIYFVPDVTVFDLIQARVDVVDGIPVLAVCETPFQGVHGSLKRLMDILVSATALVALAPVMALVAMAIRYESPGPIIFRQRRYGLDGRDIVVYKFRSMTVTEDGDKQYRQVTVGDSRVTRVGRLIRATSLDELPQFINVLQGRMSIVGPRPHAVAVNEHYRKLISGYMIRHKVRPGITGWAQVNGYRGGDDINQMRKRIEFDLEYLRSWTLRLDVYILLRTVLLVFRDAKAY
jgi:putative colanic acid biosynthesis UDP-glucose lipid carrier transferase